MTTTSQTLVPRQGRDRVDHGRYVQERLESSVYGLTVDECIQEIYAQYYGSPTPAGSRLEYEQEEFKRSVRYGNERFERREPGSVWVRTRRRPPNEWVYMAVAKIARGTGQDLVVRLLEEAVSVESYERYYKDWETRTTTLTRMQVLDIEARRWGALMRGDQQAAQAIEAELDRLKVISPRLGLMYFGAGLADENLQILENDPRARLINKQLKGVRQGIKRLQKSTAELATTVETLLRIRGVL